MRTFSGVPSASDSLHMSSSPNPQTDADQLEAVADQAMAACGGDGAMSYVSHLRTSPEFPEPAPSANKSQTGIGDMDSEIGAGADKPPGYPQTEWQRITTAPFGRDLGLAVIDGVGTHALVFPCRRVLRGWVKVQTDSPVNVHPTHWREWDDSVSPFFVPVQGRLRSMNPQDDKPPSGPEKPSEPSRTQEEARRDH